MPPPAGKTGIRAKRIANELREIARENNAACSAAPLDENNTNIWRATLTGPEGTPYAGGVFELDVHLGPNYPFGPPEVRFRTKIYHCNINEHGAICLDLLADKWAASLNIHRTLLSILSLLGDPNPADPLVQSIAKQYREDREAHDAEARRWTAKYASPP